MGSSNGLKAVGNGWSGNDLLKPSDRHTLYLTNLQVPWLS